MDIKEPAKQPRKPRSDYAAVIDEEIAPTKRKIATTVLLETETKQAAELAGTKDRYIHKQSGTAVMIPKMNALARKEEVLNKLISELDGIIEMQPETPLKYSDKLAALKLRAEVEGITSDKPQGNTTINIGVMDLRQATEEQLTAQLAELERKSLSVIDVTPIHGEDTPIT